MIHSFWNLVEYQSLLILTRIYLYVKYPFKSKYQLVINGREKEEIKKIKNPKAFIDYSQTIDYVYKNLEDYITTKKRRELMVFDDIIADMESNKELSPIVTKPFLCGRKINISLAFISQSYSKVSKTIRINATHCLS